MRIMVKGAFCLELLSYIVRSFFCDCMLLGTFALSTWGEKRDANDHNMEVVLGCCSLLNSKKKKDAMEMMDAICRWLE